MAMEGVCAISRAAHGKLLSPGALALATLANETEIEQEQPRNGKV
jgi:hypothetical protein